MGKFGEKSSWVYDLEIDFQQCFEAFFRRGKILGRELKCMQTCFKILFGKHKFYWLKEQYLLPDRGYNWKEKNIHLSSTKANFTQLIHSFRVWYLSCRQSRYWCSDISCIASSCCLNWSDRSWKIVGDANIGDADAAVKNLVWFMGSCKSGLSVSLRRYLSKLDVCFSPKVKIIVQTDDKFLFTASAITLAIQPFSLTSFDPTSLSQFDMHSAAEQYCLCLLKIPRLTQRLPAVLIRTVKHKSTLSPCLQSFLIKLWQVMTDFKR